MMMRRTSILYAAWLAYAASWFLPVFDGPTDLNLRLGAWAAFRVALTPLWPYEGTEVSGIWALLSVMSALSNAFMIASPLILLVGSRSTITTFMYGAVGCFLVNAQWPLSIGSFERLRLAYFLWWGSFGLMAVATFSMRRVTKPAATGGLTTA